VKSVAIASRVVGAGIVGVLVACVTASCARQTIDLGLNDASTTTPATAAQPDGAVFPSGYGCADWVDQDLTTLRGSTCTGGCGDKLGIDLYALASHEELEAATAGQWLYCTPTAPIGPKDAIGIEFAPGCRIYFLVHDANGEIVRGTMAAYQADFDIYDLSDGGAPKRIDLNLPGDGGEDTHTFDVKVSHCPNLIELRSAADGTVILLSSDFGDAGRGPPVVK
jgi:hypothetical protein